jgi:transcriptional regulator
MMVDARVTEGENLREMLDEIFDNKEVEYIHIHNAKPECYNCLVKRV